MLFLTRAERFLLLKIYSTKLVQVFFASLVSPKLNSDMEWSARYV